MAKILVVDDQNGMRRSLAILLEKEGFYVQEAENGQRAVDILSKENFDVVVTDLKMSPGTGLDLLYYVKEKHPLTHVIIMTAYGTIESAVIAMKIGAYDYIPKPFKREEILHRIRKAVDNIRIKKDMLLLHEGKDIRERFYNIVGKSEEIKNLIISIEKISKVNLPLLITGETGTGKNLVAKTVHNLSPRADKPFISINCAAVPEYLLESELFGHVKGAFTGAYIERKGLFEQADGGTILLDEIGSMPYPMQVKILDVLQDKVIRHVGSNKTKTIDVRIIAATNKNLEEAINEGRFREDLYFRLKVTHIHLPPLREHKDDIPLLANHFLELAKKELKKPDLRFAIDAIEYLCQYSFLGNIRELSNIVYNAAALSSNSVIRSEDLTLGITSDLFELSKTEEKLTPKSLEEWEKELIIKSIQKHSHNLTKVCEELGIARTTLWRKMKKYNID
jgi:DNA-binding NtrC family response regulator